MLFYNTEANTQYTAQRMLATPSTFTAALLVSATEAPEPASLFLVLIAGFAGLGVARLRNGKRRQRAEGME